MSDYLLQLAARVVHPERNVRPRVASVFEAVSSDGVTDETGASIATTDTAARLPAVASRSGSEADRRASQVREPDFADREFEGHAIPVFSSRGAQPTPVAAAAASRNGELSALIPARHDEFASPQGVEARDVEMPADPQRVHGIEMEADAAIVDGRHAGERRIIDSHTVIDARRFRSRTFVTLSSPPPALVPRAPMVGVVAPIRTAVRGAGRPAPGVDHRDASAPAIHVSIGRVEVRASSSAETSRARRAAAPSGMTLNEYLRQRAGVTR